MGLQLYKLKTTETNLKRCSFISNEYFIRTILMKILCSVSSNTISVSLLLAKFCEMADQPFHRMLSRVPILLGHADLGSASRWNAWKEPSALQLLGPILPPTHLSDSAPLDSTNSSFCFSQEPQRLISRQSQRLSPCFYCEFAPDAAPTASGFLNGSLPGFPCLPLSFLLPPTPSAGPLTLLCFPSPSPVQASRVLSLIPSLLYQVFS